MEIASESAMKYPAEKMGSRVSKEQDVNEWYVEKGFPSSIFVDTSGLALIKNASNLCGHT